MLTEREAKIYNGIFFMTGVVPFFPFACMALMFQNAEILLGPVVGFVPVDFVFPHFPPPAEVIRFWFWAAGATFFVLGILGAWKKPYGIIFAIAVWSSTATLFIRIWLRAKEGPIFE